MNKLSDKLYYAERKAELKRNDAFYRTGNGRYLVPIDALLAKIDEENDPAWLSDGGHGVELIVASIDETRDLLADAFARVEAECPDARDVFTLILKNGKDRRRSIEWLINNPESRKRQSKPPTSGARKQRPSATTTSSAARS